MKNPSVFSRLPPQQRVAAALLALAAVIIAAAAVGMLFQSCAPSDVPTTAAAPRAAAPGSTGPARAVPSGKPQPELRTVTIRSGSVELVAELAVSPGEQEAGLMFRKDLPDGRGMLFVYAEDRRMAFWMKNTLVPLSIAYIGADGVIKEIRDMEPLSLAPVESERYVRYALEVPKGWFGRVGLRPGDRFDLSGIASGR